MFYAGQQLGNGEQTIVFLFTSLLCTISKYTRGCAVQWWQRAQACPTSAPCSKHGAAAPDVWQQLDLLQFSSLRNLVSIPLVHPEVIWSYASAGAD